jgi:hypothetical protein
VLLAAGRESTLVLVLVLLLVSVLVSPLEATRVLGPETVRVSVLEMSLVALLVVLVGLSCWFSRARWVRARRLLPSGFVTFLGGTGPLPHQYTEQFLGNSAVDRQGLVQAPGGQVGQRLPERHLSGQHGGPKGL